MMPVSFAVNSKEEKTIIPEMGPPVEEKHEDTIKAIIKEIKWPRFITAVKNAIYCLIASATISCLLLGYHSIINQIMTYIL